MTERSWFNHLVIIAAVVFSYWIVLWKLNLYNSNSTKSTADTVFNIKQCWDVEQRYFLTVGTLRMLCAYDTAVNFIGWLLIETLLCVFVVILAVLGKAVVYVEEQAAPKHSTAFAANSWWLEPFAAVLLSPQLQMNFLASGKYYIVSTTCFALTDEVMWL